MGLSLSGTDRIRVSQNVVAFVEVRVSCLSAQHLLLSKHLEVVPPSTATGKLLRFVRLRFGMSQV